MAFITLRQGNATPSANATVKNSPLTNDEIDNNFANINITKLEIANCLTTATENTVVLRDGNASIFANVGYFSSAEIVESFLGSTITANTLTANTATFTGNSYIVLPSGNIAQRTDANLAGSIRYNSEDETFEGYTTEWGPIAGGGGVDPTSNVQTFSLGVGTPASNVSGQIRATDSIVAFYSDARLKNFEGKIDNPMQKILNINGYYFTENEVAKSLGYDHNERMVGVSAQELLAVFPEVVKPAPIDNKYYTVQYEKIVPLLIEAIKELHHEIEQLKSNSHQH